MARFLLIFKLPQPMAKLLATYSCTRRNLTLGNINNNEQYGQVRIPYALDAGDGLPGNLWLMS